MSIPSSWRGWLESLPVGAVLYEPVPPGDYRVLEMNEVGLAVAQTTREAVIGRTLEQLFPAARDLGLVAALDRVLQTGRPERLPVREYRDERLGTFVSNRLARVAPGLVLVLYEDVTAQVKAEHEARVRADLLAEAESLSGIGSWECELETGRLTMSAGWCRIHGTDQSPASFDELFPFAHPEDAADIRAAFDGCIQQGEVYDIQHRVIRACDREVRWVHARGRKSVNAAGQSVIRGVCRDLTALRARDERFRHLYEASPLATYTFELRGDDVIFTDCNPAARAQVGEAVERALGKPLSLVWADRPDLERDVRYCLERQEIVRRESEYTAYSTGATGIFGFVFSPVSATTVMLHLEDRTERRAAEAAVRESEARYRSLFRDAPDGIVLADASSGVILDCNPAFLKLGGWRREDVIGRLEAELHAAGSPDSPALMSVVSSSAEASFESRLVAANGDRKDVVIRAHRTRHGDLDVFMASYRDVTEQFRLEARVRESQKLESLGLMAGGVAHHFNNLLAAILGNAELALADVAAGTELAESLEQVREAAQRASMLTDQLLTYSGHGRLAPVTADLSRIVSDMRGILQVTVDASVTMIFDLASELPSVTVDGAQIQQMLVSLVLNAAEASRRGPGIVTVRTSARDLGSSQLTPEEQALGALPGPHVVIEVEDSGPGMDAPTRRRAFEPFFTTKGFGRGLGLPAVLGVARAHGGSVAIDSEPGRGTRVRVAFPVGRGSAITEEPLPARANAGRALVVDDEASLRNTLVRSLRKAGFEVVDVASGIEALDSFDGPGDFDLVLVDMTMPGLDGLSVVRRLRERGVSATVVLMSGRHDPGARAAGADAFLHKPFSLAALDALLGELKAETESSGSR